MRIYKLLALGIVLLLVASLPATALADGIPPARSDDGPSGTVIMRPYTGSVLAAPAAPRPDVVLWDNGPIINAPGGGPGGADGSIARDTTVGLVSRGFNASYASSYRVSDDFTITQAGGWQIDTVDFYVYMGGMTGTTSPITALYFQVWNGYPDDVGSTVVFGDMTTNRMTSSTWLNAYRFLESDPTDNTRPIMHVVATAGTTLPAGHYYLDWSVDGDINYTGPWQSPVTIDGETTTGDGLQYTGSWAGVVDSGLGTTLGFPFTLNGSVVDPSAVNVSGVQAQSAPVALWVLAAVAGLVLAGVLAMRRARA